MAGKKSIYLDLFVSLIFPTKFPGQTNHQPEGLKAYFVRPLLTEPLGVNEPPAGDKLTCIVHRVIKGRKPPHDTKAQSL